MTKLLLDANLSPETSRFLTETFDFDVVDLISRRLGHLRDVEVVDLAKREGRVIVTFDLDLGEMFHRQACGEFGVILLRLDVQTVEVVNATLERFFRERAAAVALDRSLVIIDDARVRVITKPALTNQ